MSIIPILTCNVSVKKEKINDIYIEIKNML